MLLIEFGQKSLIGIGIDAGKAIARAVLGPEPPILQPALGQAFHLNPGVTTDVDQKGQEQSLIRFGLGVVGEPNQRSANEIIALRLGPEGKLDRLSAIQKGTDLRECGDVLVIHDGIHPSIMTRDQATSVSFRVRNTSPVQYHLVLEEAE